MNPNTIAIVTRNAATAAQDTFRRVYPRPLENEQMEMALKAMADAVAPVMRKFEVDARLSPHNTEAHYAAAVLAIATAGVRALAYAPSPEHTSHVPVSRPPAPAPAAPRTAAAPAPRPPVAPPAAAPAAARAPAAPAPAVKPGASKSIVTSILAHRKSA